MQTTSQTYKDIIATQNYSVECKALVNGVTYGEDKLISMNIRGSLFSENRPKIGSCVAREIDMKLLNPTVSIPRMAEIKPYFRVTDGANTSEWLPKGIYNIDTREIATGEVPTLTIHGFDRMLLMERAFANSSETSLFPMTVLEALEHISGWIYITDGIQIGIDARTYEFLQTHGTDYEIPFTGFGEGAYTMREVLGYIGAMFCGCWVFNEVGDLRLVLFGDVPPETYYLVSHDYYNITFGGDRILITDGEYESSWG